MFEEMNTSMSIVIVVHGLLNVCVVFTAYHNHIRKSWWKLKHVGWEIVANAPMDPV